MVAPRLGPCQTQCTQSNPWRAMAPRVWPAWPLCVLVQLLAALTLSRRAGSSQRPASPHGQSAGAAAPRHCSSRGGTVSTATGGGKRGGSNQGSRPGTAAGTLSRSSGRGPRLQVCSQVQLCSRSISQNTSYLWQQAVCCGLPLRVRADLRVCRQAALA
jgi:hypothetical protein